MTRFTEYFMSKYMCSTVQLKLARDSPGVVP